MPIGLDFSANAATLAGATLQHLRATFQLIPGAVLVQDVEAELPGNADLRLSGRIGRTEGSSPGFTGSRPAARAGAAHHAALAAAERRG